MAGMERQHQPVQETPAAARRFLEQPIHRRGEPKDRQPFAKRACRGTGAVDPHQRSEEHTSELQSLMRTSYAAFCLKQKNSQQYATFLLKQTTTNTQTK